MTDQPPPILSLEPILRCPDRRCRRPLIDVDLDFGSASALRCPNKKCRAHWWATRLQAGSISAQLMRDFEDEMVVERMMRMFEAFELPTEIDRSLYWQIWLTGPEWYTYNKNQTSGPSGRALTLFRRLIHLHQRAS